MLLINNKRVVVNTKFLKEMGFVIWKGDMSWKKADVVGKGDSLQDAIDSFRTNYSQ